MNIENDTISMSATALSRYQTVQTAKSQELTVCPRPPKMDFQASWIWAPSHDTSANWRNSYVHFRRRFRAVGNLTIEIAADTHYDLFIDGHRIDRGTMSSDVAYKNFDTHHINVGSGLHVIAVLVHHLGESCATAMKSRPGLLVELTQSNGAKIVTDDSWKVWPSQAYEQAIPCMMSHFGFYEVCDYRQIPIDWASLDFNDSRWLSAQLVGPANTLPWTRLIPRDIPLLATQEVEISSVVCKGCYSLGSQTSIETHQTIAVEMAAKDRERYADSTGNLPVTLGRSQKNEFAVIDFGREVTGHLRLSFLPAPDGQKIDVGYDEILSSKGVPNPRRTYVHFADRYILRSGQTSLEVFNPRGFRYLLLDIPAGKGGVTFTKIILDERTYPVPRQGFFRCSNPGMGKFYQIGLNSVRLSMLDTYVDCPSRERVMWMDFYIQALVSSYGMGITQLWRRSIFLFAQNVSKNDALNGAVKGFAPCDHGPVYLTYMMFYVFSVTDYLLYSGDLEACQNLWETVMKQFEVIGSFTLESGLVGDQWPSENFLDWSAMDYGGVSSCVNAIYIKMHQRTADFADALGKKSIAQQLRKKSKQLLKHYREYFYLPEEDLFVDALYNGEPSKVRSQLANILAIWIGATDHDQAHQIVKRITDETTLLPRTPGDYRLCSDFQCQTGGIVQIGTPALGYLMAHVMFMMGLNQQAIEYVEKNWACLGQNGAFAEHFEWDEKTSFCHGWGAGPTILCSRFLLGVKPLATNWQQISISPQPGELEWAQGSIPLPQGDIFVSWTREENQLEVHFQLPEGVSLANPSGLEHVRQGKFLINCKRYN